MTKHDPTLSLLFHALADPTRRDILARLGAGPAPVSALAEPTGLRLPTVMRHLAVLEEAGLIATAKQGRTRTCALVPGGLDPVQAWLDRQRATWEARLDRLEAYLARQASDEPGGRDEPAGSDEPAAGSDPAAIDDPTTNQHKDRNP